MPERIRVGVNLSVRAIAREMVERGECLGRPLAQWLSACFSFRCALLAQKANGEHETGRSRGWSRTADRSRGALEGSARQTADFGCPCSRRFHPTAAYAAASSVCSAADLGEEKAAHHACCSQPAGRLGEIPKASVGFDAPCSSCSRIEPIAEAEKQRPAF